MSISTFSQHTTRIEEPIAIVGIGCRFPGGISDVDSFWNLLKDGTDTIKDIPPERFNWRGIYHPTPGTPGKSYVRQAGFIEQSHKEMDARFFNITPREAVQLDPQQRLLLEVAWEAISDAGMDADQLRGSDTSVFVGSFVMDMLTDRQQRSQRLINDQFSATTSTKTMLASRISYFFDLRGPCSNIDTACSSSLVATHLGCESIRRGESQVALVAGVNIMTRPEFFGSLAAGHFASPTNRCHAFSDLADGYVRGEGAGLVVLKSLSRAMADGDRIYATIRGTGTNQDGRTVGISAPRPEAQAALFRSVLQQSGVAPREIAFMEAHGTGTQAGDAAEVMAIQSVLEPDGVAAGACPIGSIKTNIGHTESVAGVAGLIKAALCLYRRELLPSLHADPPNSKLDWETLCVRVLRESEMLPSSPTPLYAAVNSFGYGGSNANVVLASPPPTPSTATSASPAPTSPGPWLFPFSARSEEALRAVAGQLATHGAVDTLANLAHTLTQRSTHLPDRLALVAESPAELRQLLAAHADDDAAPNLVCARAGSIYSAAGVLFVFSGMGPQWWGMGRELLAGEPVFRAAIEACDEGFRELSGWSLLEEWQVPESDSRMSQASVAQPMSTALQIGLAALWASWGITPSAVLGHSVGEVAAAQLAGMFSRREAVRVAWQRGRLQQTMAGHGGLLAVGCSADAVQEWLQAEPTLSLAAENSPVSVTLGGEPEALDRLAVKLTEAKIFAKRVRVDVAYHTAYMDPLEHSLKDALASLEAQPPALPFYSSVAGERLTESTCDAAYWWRNVRQPVRFATALAAAVKDDFNIVLELGAHPALSVNIAEVMKAEGATGVALHSLRRKEAERPCMLRNLGRLYCLGLSPRWEAVMPPGGHFTALPTYPWQRQVYWVETEESAQEMHGLHTHPLLSERDMRHPAAWTIELTPPLLPWIPDHQVDGRMVFPGAGYVEACLAAHREKSADLPVTLEDLQFTSMLALENDYGTHLLTRLDSRASLLEASVWSQRGDRSNTWTRHARGRIIPGLALVPDQLFTLPDVPWKEESVEELYDKLAATGLTYGPAFRTLQRIRTHEQQIAIELAAEADDRWLINPSILDGAWQALALHANRIANGQLFLPAGMRRLDLFQPITSTSHCHIVVTREMSAMLIADMTFHDATGLIQARIYGMNLRLLPSRKPQMQPVQTHVFKWEMAPTSKPGTATGDWLVFGTGTYLDEQMLQAIRDRGAAARLVPPGTLPEVHELPDASGGILFARGLADAQDVPATALASCVELSALIKLLNAAARTPRLIVVTAESQPVEGGDTVSGLAYTSLWGMTRVIEIEYPAFCRLVDVQREAAPAMWIADAIDNGPETEVAWRDGVCFVHRLRQDALPEQEIVAETAAANEPLVLGQATRGTLDSLAFRRTVRVPPQADEVEVRVHYVGLNYKDVLKALGQLPPEVMLNTGSGEKIGLECSGIVVAVGSDVRHVAVGDQVYAWIPGCFQTYLTMQSKNTYKIPSNFPMSAAPILVPYATVVYGLGNLAGLKAGQTLLIHSATGSVGLAAIYYARSVGAVVLATAGTEERRQYLRDMGIEHVFDSRSLTFHDAISKITAGKGVDVVIGAVSGESIRQSIELLSIGGHYVDLGKRDMLEHQSLPMQFFTRSISYHGLDLDHLVRDRMDLIVPLLTQVHDGLCSGKFGPLPVTVVPGSDLPEAFRLIAMNKHLGRVIVSMTDEDRLNLFPGEGESHDKGGQVLITGGTRGVGLALASWLVQNGARHLVLISRSGHVDEADLPALAQMRDRGARIEVLAVDVADRESLSHALVRLRQTGIAIRGIYHGAMVLDDDLIVNLTAERMARVFSPKITGAWNLHLLTADDPLERFVCFTSVAGMLGNLAQASYVAANSWLDGLAAARHAAGRPALAVAMGAIGNTGVISRSEMLERALVLRGYIALSTDQIFPLIDRSIERGVSCIGFFNINWRVWLNHIKPPPIIAELVEQQPADGPTEAISTMKLKLMELPEAERSAAVLADLQKRLGKLLNMPAKDVDTKCNLIDLGIDSLLAAEVSTMIYNDFGHSLSTLDVAGGISLSGISESIVRSLNVESAES